MPKEVLSATDRNIMRNSFSLKGLGLFKGFLAKHFLITTCIFPGMFISDMFRFLDLEYLTMRSPILIRSSMPSITGENTHRRIFRDT